jgi:hypothetical protein
MIARFGRYCYRYDGNDLKAGDSVLLPANWAFPEQVAVVDAVGATPADVGSDYTGPLSTVIRRLDPSELEDAEHG